MRGGVPAVAGRALRGEQLPQEFLAGPGGADLTGRVNSAHYRLEPGKGFAAEVVAAAEQEPAVGPGRVDGHAAPAQVLA